MWVNSARKQSKITLSIMTGGSAGVGAAALLLAPAAAPAGCTAGAASAWPAAVPGEAAPAAAAFSAYACAFTMAPTAYMMLLMNLRRKVMHGSCTLMTTCAGTLGSGDVWYTTTTRHERGRLCGATASTGGTMLPRECIGAIGGIGMSAPPGDEASAAVTGCCTRRFATSTLRCSAQPCRSSTRRLEMSILADKPPACSESDASCAGFATPLMCWRLRYSSCVSPGRCGADLALNNRGFSSITSYTASKSSLQVSGGYSTVCEEYKLNECADFAHDAMPRSRHVLDS